MLPGRMRIIRVWLTGLLQLEKFNPSAEGLGYTIDKYNESPGAGIYYKHFGQVTLYNNGKGSSVIETL
jgi:hypothetical protein